jgi:hypothetical protein
LAARAGSRSPGAPRARPARQAKQELAGQVKGIVANCVELCNSVLKGAGTSQVGVTTRASHREAP